MFEREYSRRQLLALLPVALLARMANAAPVRLLALGSVVHPAPRPGITAARVLTANRLTNRLAEPVYAMVREIPQVIDGIHCYCGCAGQTGFHSLLSCFEGDGMAQHCQICQGEARLVHRLNSEGWSLSGIRTSIDASFADAV
ncbi:MAG: hypothetical protein H0T48_02245 [Gemmatimonadaceae bacterium]|nr:hypothetical protein [Gemmatimonadaceae bacterium]